MIPDRMPTRERPSLKLRVDVAYGEFTGWLLRHHRLARAAFRTRDATMWAQASLLRGDRQACPCCGGRFRRFLQGHVTIRRNICPGCHSYSRQRAIALLLEQMDLDERRILHFAPETALDRFFARMPEANRVTTDLVAPADLRLDITKIDLPDDSFDLVLCSHVLEHIPDDRAAMRELARILAPGGLALIVVPYFPQIHTREDPTVTDPLRRAIAFGQPDHVRVYGSDLAGRLLEAGFEVEHRSNADRFEPETVDRCRLLPREHVFRCQVK